MNEKSKLIAKSFAEEIKEMSNSEILFLSFPFISDSFSLDFVKTKYQELINNRQLSKGLKIEEAVWDFDRVFEQFIETKIEIKDTRIRFLHPSYYWAFQYAISQNGFITTVGRILSIVLTHLSYDNQSALFNASSHLTSNQVARCDRLIILSLAIFSFLIPDKSSR
jgi:hypothetical protein